jgi:HEAT repeat protein
MTSASPELQLALESDCATGVEEVIAARRGEDLEALRNMLRPDAPVSPAFRQNAIQLLGLWGDAESAPAIRALLPELDERQRINAVDALGRLGGPEAEASVLDATRDASPDVRRFAAYALSRIRSEAAQERLQQMAREDPEPSTRTAAERSMSSPQ